MTDSEKCLSYDNAYAAYMRVTEKAHRDCGAACVEFEHEYAVILGALDHNEAQFAEAKKMVEARYMKDTQPARAARDLALKEAVQVFMSTSGT